MAVELGTGYVSITPSTKGFGRALSGQITGPVSQSGRAAGSTMGASLLGGLQAVAVVGAVAIGAAIGKGITSGFSFNSAVQDGKAAFNVLLKDATKSANAIAFLFDYGAKTPFRFGEVLNAGKSLAAVGLDIQKNIGWIGNIGAVFPDAGGITAVASAIARLSSGNFGESFERLREFGISRDKLEGKGLKFDKGGQFQGTVKEALDAVRAIADEQYGGMTDAMSKTFSGQWSTILDNLNMKMGEATKPLFDWVTNTGLPAFNAAFGGLDFTVLFQTLAPLGDALSQSFKELAAAAGPAFTDLAKQLLPEIQAALPGIVATVRDFSVVLADSMPGIVNIVAGFTKLGIVCVPHILRAVTAVASLGVIIGGLVGSVARVEGTFAAGFTMIANTIILNVNRALTAVNKLRKAMGLGAIGGIGYINTVGAGRSVKVNYDAEGAIATSPRFGWTGEDGPEAIIPLNSKPRSRALLSYAMDAMGAPGAGDITLNLAIDLGGKVERVTRRVTSADVRSGTYSARLVTG